MQRHQLERLWQDELTCRAVGRTRTSVRVQGGGTRFDARFPSGRQLSRLPFGWVTTQHARNEALPLARRLRSQRMQTKEE